MCGSWIPKFQKEFLNISASNEVIKILRDSGIQLSNENWQTLAKNLNVPDAIIETQQREQAIHMSSYWDPLEECIDWWIRNSPNPFLSELVHALDGIDKRAAANIQREKLGGYNLPAISNSSDWTATGITRRISLISVTMLLIAIGSYHLVPTWTIISFGLLILLCCIISSFVNSMIKVHNQVSTETKNDAIQSLNEIDVTNSKSDFTPLEHEQQKPSINDRIWESGDSGIDVMEKCIEKMMDEKILTEDINAEFMRRLAFVMSRYGQPLFKLLIDGGIWQVSKHAFVKTQEEQYVFTERCKKCEELLHENEWRRVSKMKLEKPIYSAVAAFLYLSTIGKPVPPSSDVLGQQDYWWNYYMDKHEAKRFMECSEYEKGVKILNRQNKAL